MRDPLRVHIWVFDWTGRFTAVKSATMCFRTRRARGTYDAVMDFSFAQVLERIIDPASDPFMPELKHHDAELHLLDAHARSVELDTCTGYKAAALHEDAELKGFPRRVPFTFDIQMVLTDGERDIVLGHDPEGVIDPEGAA